MMNETYNVKRLFDPEYMPSNIATTEIECGSCGHTTSRNAAKTESSLIERGKFQIDRCNYYCPECDNWLRTDEIAIVPNDENEE